MFKKIFIIFLLTFPAFLSSENKQIQEYQFKAVILDKMTHHVKWPHDDRPGKDDGKLILGITGKDPIRDSFVKIFRTVPDFQKKYTVLIISDLDQISECDILFITKSEERNLQEIIRRTEYKPILTIGDKSDFCQKGTLLCFRIVDRKINFDANIQAIEKSPLSISYHLLQRARNIKGKRGSR